MRDDLPIVQERLDQAAQMIEALATLVLGGTESVISTTWECVNRVCDRYDLSQAA